MEPARVALDIQALQQGGGADPVTRRAVAARAGVLARRGRLAAALLAPELPPPDPADLPPELLGAGQEWLRWDCRQEARALLSSHARLVHHVPAPLLHSEPGDPGGRLVGHWSDMGAFRLVTLREADVERLQSPTDRLEARLEWIRRSHLVEAEDGAGLAHLGLGRVVPPGELPDGLDRLYEAPGEPDLRARIAVFGPFPPGGGGIGAYNARFVTALAATGARVDAVTTTGMGWDPPGGVALVHEESFGTDVRPASYDAVVYTLGNSDGHLATVEAALRHPGWLWLHEARLPAIATTALASLDDPSFTAQLERLLQRAYPGRPPAPAARAAGRSHLALAAAGVGLTAPLVERAAGVLVNSTAARHALLLDLPPLAWRPPVVVLPPACPPVRPAPGPPAAGGVGPGEATVVSFGVVSMGKRPDLLVDAVARAGCRLAFVGPCPEILETVIRDRAAACGITDRVEVAGQVDDEGWWGWMERAELAVQLRESTGGEMSAAVLDALAAGVPVLTNLASARDYPAGTVELIEGVNPSAERLASAIGRLLGPAGRERRQSLSSAGREFAASHQMAGLAAVVAASVAPVRD